MDISIQVATRSHDLPSEDALRRWASAAYAQMRDRDGAEITLRIVDEVEMRDLNRRYRHADQSTNVLAFVFEDPPHLSTGILGDVIVCAPVVAREASQLRREAQAHWAHMVVHGVLHLCGLDHKGETEAQHMEAMESRILSELGFASPYEQ